MMFVDDTSEVEALKSALAEAKKEVEEEQASRLKHESRLAARAQGCHRKIRVLRAQEYGEKFRTC